MGDLETRTPTSGQPPNGLAEVFSLHTHRAGRAGQQDERSYFFDTLAEYQWARDAAGLMPSSIDQLVKPVLEICEHYDLVPWQLTPTLLDRYFAGPGKRARPTVRTKINKIDAYFAFLEQRYAGEIHRRFGTAVESQVDPFNRPRHRGDFGLRVPPSQRAMREFFAAWRDALPRAPQAGGGVPGLRDGQARLPVWGEGVRAVRGRSVRCALGVGQVGPVRRAGQGRPRLRAPAARGVHVPGGPRLLWWYVEEVRGLFHDDPEHPLAPLFPSERLPVELAAANIPVAAAITPGTFRRNLKAASLLYLPGPVGELYPHLLRHACATHNYERGMTLWEVQRLLGHTWTTTTVNYLATAQADPEHAERWRQSATRAGQRLVADMGSLR
ncbi:site-specific integrase [Streptomyces labedae]|uniref:Tyr recombinase domain-containing protein n=1 Tax=Streptomyces labedae TaxID=285569 RepID=A0ABP6QR46_9ACTN